MRKEKKPRKTRQNWAKLGKTRKTRKNSQKLAETRQNSVKLGLFFENSRKFWNEKNLENECVVAGQRKIGNTR